MAMNLSLRLTRQLALRLPGNHIPRNRQSGTRIRGRPRLLVIGVYMALEPNHAPHIIKEINSAKLVDVEQRWVCMMGHPTSADVAAVTIRQTHEYVAKWRLVNELISSDDLNRFDYFIICDDDILLGHCFVDLFIAEQQSLNFALAQPARTWRSFTDHAIVRRRLFARARQTNFVEAGPVVSFRQDFFKTVYPFSMESPMGWGYDLTWPIVARELSLAIGIVDAIPVDHSLRPRSALYNMQKQIDVMASYLSKRPHVSSVEVARAVRIFR
jgi:hypothetical protein